jgi:hypothetical protein
MPTRSPLAWPVLDLIEQELLDPAVPCPCQTASPVDADALYMADCEVFLERDGADGFTLTLRTRGEVSEVKLTASVDPAGLPKLLALVG